MFISRLATELKTASGRQKSKPVLKIAESYEFLITDSESTHNVTSIGKFLVNVDFVESWTQNPDFLLSRTAALVPDQTDPDSDLLWSKVPPTISNTLRAPLPLGVLTKVTRK